ncbi:hypothetical protein [Dyadobacter sp. 676]|uniref:Uncharacterized protein n=1 Tax=Dyadobacter sp. 676 TaxID=3088362 RepID=A0AAU8FG97_9BACT
MAAFIYNLKQQRAINLDNIDSIRKDNAGGFEIVFERALPNGSQAGLTEVDRWRFPTEKERDEVLQSILEGYGLRFG